MDCHGFINYLIFLRWPPFLSGARMELSQKQPAMMTLIAMGISVSYFYSLYGFIMNLVNPTTHVMNFFWELATLIVVMLLGHWIEMNAVSNASNSLKKLRHYYQIMSQESHNQEKKNKSLYLMFILMTN